MKQAYCQRDIFHAPTDGEIICRGVVQQDVPVGTKCSITCNAAIADPREIACLPSGWDAGKLKSILRDTFFLNKFQILHDAMLPPEVSVPEHRSPSFASDSFFYAWRLFSINDLESKK